MIIKSLKMKNYRPYKDVKPINFAYGDSNLTIIEGDNDLGKTTILNAIAWCLYDDEPFRKYSNREFNVDVGNNLRNGEKLQVVVEILMEDNEGNDVIFNRTREFKKNNSGNITKVANLDELEIHISSSSSGDEPINNPTKYLETHLPSSLKEYFLFDGERLLEWFSGDTKEVKHAINRLYQADLLENIKKRIETQRDNFIEDLREYNEELADLNRQKTKLESDCKEEKEKFEENKKLIEGYKEEKEGYEKIKNSTDGNPNELLEEINILGDEIQDKKNELDKLKNDHMGFLFKNFPIVIGFPSLKKILSIKNENEYGENYKFKDTEQILKLIENLFDQKKCVCGSDLIEGTSAFSNLSKFKEVVTNMENSNNVDDFQEKIMDLLNKYPESLNEIIDDYWEKEGNSLDYIEKRKEKISKKQEKYDTIIKDINLEEIDEKIKNCGELITKLEAKNMILEDNIKDYPKKIENIQNQIDLIKTTNEDEEKIKNKIEFCKKIAKHSDYLKNELGSRLHEEIQESVNKEFESIYNADGTREKYKRIIIDESFDISIEKVDGEINTSVDPSSGAQLAVALSFITAINARSGYRLPQIMDTSLSRWGNRLKNNFTKILPDYLEKNQMVFLFLDSEYEGPIKEKIIDYVGKEYELDYAGPNTTIIKERIKEN